MDYPYVTQCDTVHRWRAICGGRASKPAISGLGASAIRARSGSNQGERWRRPQIRIGLCATPTPVSRFGAVRIIGFSSSAGFVLTVIVDAADGAGITTWTTSGADLRAYEGGSSDR